MKLTADRRGAFGPAAALRFFGAGSSSSESLLARELAARFFGLLELLPGLASRGGVEDIRIVVCDSPRICEFKTSSNDEDRARFADNRGAAAVLGTLVMRKLELKAKDAARDAFGRRALKLAERDAPPKLLPPATVDKDLKR